MWALAPIRKQAKPSDEQSWRVVVQPRHLLSLRFATIDNFQHLLPSCAASCCDPY
jgi:hypothetical protein